MRVCVCAHTYEELPGEHLIPAGITQLDDATKPANRNHIMRRVCVSFDPLETDLNIDHCILLLYYYCVVCVTDDGR